MAVLDEEYQISGRIMRSQQLYQTGSYLRGHKGSSQTITSQSSEATNTFCIWTPACVVTEPTFMYQH